MDAPMMTPPCPDNWQSCDFCGAGPNETCRNPDVNAARPLNGTEGCDPGQHGAAPLPKPFAPVATFTNAVSAFMEAVPSVADGSAPRIIGLTGFKRTGKDTAAEVIAKMLGYDRVQFAGPLKEMLRTLLRYQGVSEAGIEACVEGDLKEAPAPVLGGKTPRLAMQTLGTEWGRQTLSDTIWVDTALGRAGDAENGALITDVRFLNEAEAVKAAGGVIIRIERAEVGLKSDHPSEVEIPQIEADFVLRNDTNRASFQDEVAAFAWRHFLSKSS